MAAAALVAVVVIVAVVIALTTHGSNSTSPPVIGTTGSGGGGGSPIVAATAVPTAAPAGIAWRLFGQVALPYSTSAGPNTVTATTASGYEHSPVGALIAAAQLSTRSGLSSGRSSYDPTIENQFVPSPDRDALLAALHNAPQESAAPGELAQIAGFIYQAYSPDTAVVGLVSRGSAADSYFVTTLTVQWRDGDWRMVAPPGGSWLSLTRQAPDLTGVVPWGAH